MEAILKLQKKIDFYVPMKPVREGLLLALVWIGICFTNECISTQEFGCEMKNVERIAGYSQILDVDSLVEKACREAEKAFEKCPTSPKAQEVPQEQPRKFEKTILKEAKVDAVAATDVLTTDAMKVPEKTMEVPQAQESAEVVLVNKDMKILLHGNGGVPEMLEYCGTAEGFCIDDYSVPTRTGKEFVGWYLDEACTIPYEGILEYQETLELYAGWKTMPGFILNDAGYIVGYTEAGHVLLDGIVVLPNSKACVGLSTEALEGLGGLVSELYIPANIVKIEEGALDGLENLLYIEVDANNPVYCSIDGILYEKTGKMVSIPGGRK